MTKTSIRKRILALCIVAVMVSMLFSVTASAAGAFTDVPDAAYYTYPVKWALDRSITQGTSSTRFSPKSFCTRGQAVTFLWRMVGSPHVEAENPFTDVKSGTFYYDAVLWAVENSITQGTSDTTFSPDATVTRGQIVTFLYRTFADGYESWYPNIFTDVHEDDFCCKAVLWAVETGITHGTSVTTFSPGENCTRGDLVTFLYRQNANLFKAEELDYESFPGYDFYDDAVATATCNSDTLDLAWEAIIETDPRGTYALEIVQNWLNGDTSGVQYREDGTVCAYLFSSRKADPDDTVIDLALYVSPEGYHQYTSISWNSYEFDFEDENLAVATMDYHVLADFSENYFDLDFSDKSPAEIVQVYLGNDVSGAQYRKDGSIFAYLFEAKSTDPADEYSVIRLVISVDKDGMLSGISSEAFNWPEEEPTV